MSGMMAVVPAYQAAENVGAVVRGIRPRVDGVLVVDDGSTDGTADRAAKAGARVLAHPRNRGKGAALRSGIQAALAAGARRIVTLDADGQHDPADLERLVRRMEETGAPVVVGSRLHDRDASPAYRRRTNRIGGAVISALVGLPLTDVQSGYRLYESHLLRRIPIRSDGFAADSEILVRIGLAGYLPVAEPIRVIYPEDHRGRSHFLPIRDTYRICVTVLRIMLGLY